MSKGLPPLLILVLALGVAPAWADEEASLRALVEGVVGTQLERYRIPGATVAVVKDGRTVLLQGYGYAMELLQALLERYHPASASSVPPPAPDFRQRAARFEGGYQTTWRAFTTAEASLGWRWEMRVSAGPEGTLRIHGPGVSTHDWVEVEPRVFQARDGSPGHVVFREDAQGHITHLFFENRPGAAYVKAPWYETSGFTYALLSVCAGSFTLAVAGVLFMRGPGAWLLALLGLSELTTLGSVALLLRPDSVLGTGALRAELLLTALQGSALLGVLLLLGVGGQTVRAWWRRSGSLLRRLLLAEVTLAAALFTAWLEHWHFFKTMP